MKQYPVLSQPQEIIEELRWVQQMRAPLFMRLKGKVPGLLNIHEIKEQRAGPVILLDKRGYSGPTVSPDADCWYLYRKDGCPRGFMSPVIRQSPEQLILGLPEVIYQFQRRRDERIVVPEGSGASLVLADWQKTMLCTPLDISRGGACLAGRFPKKMEIGRVLGPVTFTLRLNGPGPGIKTITITEVSVAWFRESADGMATVGLQFKDDDETRRKIAAYLALHSNNEEDETAASAPAAPFPPFRERRRSERVAPPSASLTTFAVSASSKVFRTKPRDITLGGACLTGPFSLNLQPGMKIGPLTFSLTRQLDRNDIATIIVGEATIVWQQTVDGVICNLGLQLQLSAGEKEKLEDYIRIRGMEELLENRGRRDRTP